MIADTRFYSIEEVAQILGVTYQLIYKLIRSGELGAIRIGRMYRVTDKDLQTYMDRQRNEIQQEAVGVVCSVCGKRYFSKLSLDGECRICGLPICRFCREIRHAQYCEIHDPQNKNVDSSPKPEESEK